MEQLIVYLHPVPTDLTYEQLHKYFSQVPNLHSVELCTAGGANTGNNKVAAVTYTDAKSALRAQRMLDGRQFPRRGHTLSIRIAAKR
jgi:hypothetical protein